MPTPSPNSPLTAHAYPLTQQPSPLRGEGRSTNEEVYVTSTRMLARRRLGTTSAPHVTAPPRRRRRTRGFVQVATAVATERLRLNVFGHAYMAVGAFVIVVLFYLAIAAQITQASYDIARLQAQQHQLRYQEVTLHAPAQVQQQAQQSGMQRVVPSSYVQGTQVAVDLTAPVGAQPADTTPLWLRAVAVVVNTVGGTQNVQAATKH